MLVIFSLIFVAVTKIISRYDFITPLTVDWTSLSKVSKTCHTFNIKQLHVKKAIPGMRGGARVKIYTFYT